MKIVVLYLFFCLSLAIASAQVAVPYLTDEPSIDGIPDVNLPEDIFHSFSEVSKSNPANPDVNAAWYLAYNAEYLYLYMEAKADSLTIRDRGYQNGDGFHLVIGKPQPGMAPTDEFYVLGFSAGSSWSRKICWYYNVGLKIGALSDNVKFETGERDGKISFELLLPWKEVYPYHPFLNDSIGFNLCFVKAIGENQKNLYFIKYDKRMQSEQSKREYIRLDFEKPASGISKFASSLLKNNISENENLSVLLAGYAEKDTSQAVSFTIISGENSVVASQKFSIRTIKGFLKQEISLTNLNLIPGGYKVRVWVGISLVGEHFLTVMPLVSVIDQRKALRLMKSSISSGTYSTLMFYLDDLELSVTNLKSYECTYSVREKAEQIKKYIEKLKAVTDPFTQKKGVYRRAYKLNPDSVLYPYSVFVPDDYTGEKKYPLLVYLHGSGDNDQVLAHTPVIQNGFIVVAPNGRGTSNCFATPDSQKDIENCIADVTDNFNIDTSKIILSGFSMGGYGVLRTYYQHPNRYKAIAILSGHPDLARKWIGPDEINFLADANLASFHAIPVYVFHSEKDMNCPFESIDKLVQKLKAQGCQVHFEVDRAGGHGNMKPEILESYFTWLRKQSE